MQKVHIKKFEPKLPLNKIEVSPENVRHTNRTAGLSDLVESIKKYDLIQPVVVIERDGKYDLIVGQRRYLAFVELERDTIPAFIIEPLNKTTQAIISLGENIHRRKLPYQDTIDACDALFRKYSGTNTQKIKKISMDLGISESTVKKYLARRIIPKSVQKLVDDGLISDDLAYRITASLFPDTKKIITIINNILKLTNPEKQRAADYGEKNPSADVRDVINYAKNPPKFIEIQIYIDPETNQELEKLSKEKNKKISSLVKEAIFRYIEDEGEE